MEFHISPVRAPSAENCIEAAYERHLARHNGDFHGWTTVFEEDGVPRGRYVFQNECTGERYLDTGLLILDLCGHYGCTPEHVYDEIMRSLDLGDIDIREEVGFGLEVLVDVP